MSNVKKFYKFLKANDYGTGLGSDLDFEENDYVSYSDMGGSFKLYENLSFTYDDEDEGRVTINFDSYEDFIDCFKGMFACY